MDFLNMDTYELEEFVDINLKDKDVFTACEGADTVAVCESVIDSTKTVLPQKPQYCEV